MQIVQSCTNVNSNRISYRYISHEISNYSETYNVPMIEKINEHKPKRHVHFFPQPSRGPFEALPLAQQGAEWALLGAHFGPFCAQCGLAQKGPEWSRGPKRTGAQSGSPSWPQLPTQLGPIRGPHGNAARGVKHQPSDCRWQDATCYKCQQRGHIVPACKTTVPYKDKKGKTHVLEDEVQEDSSQGYPTSSSSTYNMFSMTTG